MKKSFILLILLISTVFIYCAGNLKLQLSNTPTYVNQRQSYHPKAMEHFIDGSIGELQNDYKTALLEFTEALLYDSSSATIYNKVAEGYIRLKKLDSAQKILLSTIRRFPDDIESYRMLAVIYYSQHEMNKAEQCYEKIIELDPEDVEARYSLVTLYLTVDQDLKAAEEYEEIIQLGYGTPEMRLKVGNIYLENKLFDKSDKIFTEFFRDFPDDERSYLAKAKLYLVKQDTASAIDWYQQGIKKDLSFEICLEELRDLYIHQKKLDKATLLLKQVIAQDVSKIENYLRLGELYYQQGDTSRAIEEFKHVVDLFPDDFRAYFSLGSLYY